jgi:hypothetical protein
MSDSESGSPQARASRRWIATRRLDDAWSIACASGRRPASAIHAPATTVHSESII